ncbi:hypothetical protein WJX84_003856 [Apatococcus fuscideae]|uniref:AB hydrolase-1 domain-containing protein n=1 Tax=Apatococcus fuscideae TaxID=2026836 RepID=A0AAW1SP31_9CHLO
MLLRTDGDTARPSQSPIAENGALTAAAGVTAWLFGVRKKTVSLQIGGSSFQQAVLELCPTMNTPYTTYPILNNGHVETIFAARARRTPYVQYDRTILDMPDGGKVTLDAEKANSAQGLLPHEAPVVILLPGLTGGSQDSYVQHMVVAARREGVRAIVFNGRGTANSPVTSPQFYSASYTGDMKGVVAAVQKEYPQSMLMAVGWSLGANILVRYLGETRSNTPLAAAVSLCNPFNLVVADQNFHIGFNRIYDWSLANGLRQIFAKHSHLFYNSDKPFKPELAANCKSIRDFDEAVTSVQFGWPTVDTYYAGSGSADSIPDVTIPLLCIQADNDPIAPERCIPYEALQRNSNCSLVVTPGGGHLGRERSAG